MGETLEERVTWRVHLNAEGRPAVGSSQDSEGEPEEGGALAVVSASLTSRSGLCLMRTGSQCCIFPWPHLGKTLEVFPKIFKKKTVL